MFRSPFKFAYPEYHFIVIFALLLLVWFVKNKIKKLRVVILAIMPHKLPSRGRID